LNSIKAFTGLITWLFGDGFPVVSFFAGCFVTSKRLRLTELKKEVKELIDKIDSAADDAASYWANIPSDKDAIKEVSVARNLHYISVEGFRLEREYKIFDKKKLTKYNERLLEVATLDMSSTRLQSQPTAKRIGRISNLYMAYLKTELATKLKYLGFLTFSFKG